MNFFKIRVFTKNYSYVFRKLPEWKKYRRSQEYLDKVQAGNTDAIVTIEDDEVLVDGKPINLMTAEMIDFAAKIRHIDYIRFSMVEFTWALIVKFLPEHPVHQSYIELKDSMEPSLSQVLCKYFSAFKANKIELSRHCLRIRVIFHLPKPQSPRSCKQISRYQIRTSRIIILIITFHP